MRRWVCSIQVWSSAGGIQSLKAKQPGQSGHASPESVARTSPPTAIRTKVATAAASASLANRVTDGTCEAAGQGVAVPSGVPA